MKRFFKSFTYCFSGLRYAIVSEPNFRFELLSCMAVIAAGFILSITSLEWIICVLCMGAVLVSELINTAIESLTNLVSPEYHELAKKTKDLAAAAVLVSAISAAIAGLIIFVPYIITWITE